MHVSAAGSQGAGRSCRGLKPRHWIWSIVRNANLRIEVQARRGYNWSTMPKWQDILRNSVTGEVIRASNLRRIPQLKACPFWDRAIFLGRISYRVKVANYDGGLVKYDGRIYYVNRSQIEALQSFVHWDLRKNITVMED